MLASSMHQQQMHKPLWHSAPHSQTVGAPSAPIKTDKAEVCWHLKKVELWIALHLHKVSTAFQTVMFLEMLSSVDVMERTEITPAAVHHSLIANSICIQEGCVRDERLRHLNSLCIRTPNITAPCSIFTTHFVPSAALWGHTVHMKSCEVTWPQRNLPGFLRMSPTARCQSFSKGTESHGFCAFTMWNADTLCSLHRCTVCFTAHSCCCFATGDIRIMIFEV